MSVSQVYLVVLKTEEIGHFLLDLSESLVLVLQLEPSNLLGACHSNCELQELQVVDHIIFLQFLLVLNCLVI